MFKNIREDDQQRENARKLLEAKIWDKYQFAHTKNKIANTDFLNCFEKSVAEKFLHEKSLRNYVFFGGNGEDSERNILLFYPEKLSLEMVEKNYSKIVSAVRVILPKELHYEHRIYLSGIMKLGVKREKIGDILVQDNGADIIVLNEMAEFLKNSLPELTRFKSAKCDRIDIHQVQLKEKEFEALSVIVSAMRLDNFVAEFARCSRSKAIEILDTQRVFVNDCLETKCSRKINVGDRITVRGKGKFIVEEITHKTRSERLVIRIKKYC